MILCQYVLIQLKRVNMQSIVNDCIDFAFLDFFLFIYLFRISVAMRCLTYSSELIRYDALM